MEPTSNVLFSRLPLELRHMIYAHAYKPCRYIFKSSFNYVLPLPSVCYVNHATYIEAGLWYIYTAELEVLTFARKTLTHVLTTFPESSGWDSVQRIAFECFDLPVGTRLRRNNDIWQFLQKCRNVRKVSLDFRASNLLKRRIGCYDIIAAENLTVEEVECGTFIKLLKDLVEWTDIDALFELELGGLQAVYLGIWPSTMVKYKAQGGRGNRVALTALPLIEELAKYLRNGFAARGRDVKVEVRNKFRLGARRRLSAF